MYARIALVWFAATFFGFAASLHAEEAPPSRLDINKAVLTDFMKVKGIGKKIANRILEQRNKVGGFKSMKDLREVKGVGEKTYQKLVCAFFVENEGPLPCWSTPSKVLPSEQINLNTATAKELQKLNGIGPKKAELIIQHRTTVGLFRSPDELTKIKGIGKNTVEQLAPYLVFKLNLNTARGAQFEAFGFKDGDKIVKAREAREGGFKSVEEFGKLDGIDQKVFQAVKDLLYVSGESE